jgi:hypothetical protein
VGIGKPANDGQLQSVHRWPVLGVLRGPSLLIAIAAWSNLVRGGLRRIFRGIPKDDLTIDGYVEILRDRFAASLFWPLTVKLSHTIQHGDIQPAERCDCGYRRRLGFGYFARRRFSEG